MAFDPKGTVRAVIAVGKGLIALGFHEVRQDVVVAPALISAATPFVVVTAISADVDHVIDGARSAEPPALRDKDTAPIQMRLGKSSVSPVIGAVLETSIECRYPDRGFVILAAGFEQQYPAGGILGQSACQDAPRRSGTGDDVVERDCFHHPHPCAPP